MDGKENLRLTALPMSGMMNPTHGTWAFHTFATPLLNLLTAIAFWKLQAK